MRRVLLSLAVTALVATALPAGAAVEPEAAPAVEAPAKAPPPAPAPKPAKDDPDRIVCVREHVVGSNRPQKVCMTVVERDRMREAAARLLSEQRGATAPREGVGR